jgi:signal peptidase II
MKKITTFVLTLLSIPILDQLLKIIIRLSNFSFSSKILSINFVKNTGASFSILQNQNSLLLFIGILTLGLLFYKIDYILKDKSIIAWALIIGGILSNLIDRIYLGYVVDFINFHWWPVFNIADSALTIGVIILIIKDFLFGLQ